jgi:hypothetical protein
MNDKSTNAGQPAAGCSETPASGWRVSKDSATGVLMPYL